ncbi:MAG: biopolymer transporter ExbD [Muribaculaceae bacterium]|nr:biopolymer transporter ExbD [Muribaculaceae bacterium]MBR5323322.1 biopolymer transporter ExbD [Muribaculaceae bacterium]
MPRVKVKRKSTLIDMTAMSDVTVLLLTFFMLTSTFVQKEPVQVNTPDSVSEIKIPETDILQILIDQDGKIYMSLDRPADKAAVLEDVAAQYGMELTAEEISKFRTLPTFGTPIAKMKSFLALTSDQQDKALKGEVNGITAGIPCDTTKNAEGFDDKNEVKVWVKSARAANGNLRIAIKAAAGTPYPTIRNLMTSLQDIRENRYNLITNLKNIKEEERVVIK